MNLKRVFWVITTIIGMQVVASPTIQNVTAKQRYPWNGLVDITCKVSGIEGKRKFVLSAVMPDSCKVVGLKISGSCETEENRLTLR